MTSRVLSGLQALLFSALLTGCTNLEQMFVVAPTPTSVAIVVGDCAGLVHPDVVSLIVNGVSPQDATQHVQSALGSMPRPYADSNDFVWDHASLRYSLYFTADEASQARIQWLEAMPTLEDFRRCLGEPSYYGFLQQGGVFQLALYWPERGYIAWLGWPVGDNDPAVTWQSQVRTVVMVAPGTIDAILNEFFSADISWQSPEQVGFERGLLREWPGELAGLEITRCHVEPYPCKRPN